MLSFGKPDEVRAFCRRVIDEVARDGGYIMDAGAIMQDDTSIENLRVMTQTAREYGVYAAGTYKTPVATPPSEVPASLPDRQRVKGMAGRPQPRGAAWRLFPLGRARQGIAGNHRQPGAGAEDLGRHRRLRQHVYLAAAAELLSSSGSCMWRGADRVNSRNRG